MSPVRLDDDVSAEFLGYRQSAQADATVQQFMQGRAAQQAQEKPAGGAAAPQPPQGAPGAQPAPAAAGAPTAPPAAPAARPEAPPEQPGLEGVFSDRERFLQRSREATGRSAIPGVLSDFGRGLIEAPRQFIGGVSDAVHNTFTAADHLADWLNENVVDLTVPVPKTGIDAVDQLIANPAEAIAGPGGEVDPARSVTGNIIREASRFLTGFKAAGKLMGTGSGGFAALPAGAISDFVAQDPDAGRLADLWSHTGLPENQLIEFLQSDPNDSELEKRFKNSLEGAGIGALTEGVFRAIKYVRSKWLAGNQVRQTGLEAADALATQPRVDAKALEPLGDMSPDAPLVKVESADEVASRLAKATDVTETGVPDAVTAKGVAGSAKDAGKPSLPENMRTASRQALEAMDVDELDRAAFGVVSGDVVTIKPDELVIKFVDDMENPQAAFEKGGMKWAESVDLSEPVKASIDDAGQFVLEDGHHRVFAAEKRGVPVKAEIEVKGKPIERILALQETASAATAGKQTVGEAQITINFARMDSPEALKQVFRDTAEAFSGSIDEARRGTISLEETAKMADRLGMTPEQLISRTRGQAYNAEQIKAAGVVMDSATAKVFELAERAANPTASAVDQFMFRKMLAVHHAIQAEFLGVVAEAGRALNAVKIAQGGGTAEMGRAIQDMVEGLGGEGVGKALAQRLMLLRQSGAPDAAMSQFVRKGAIATTMDAVKTFWINALLSSPTTHIVNTASNTLVVAQQVVERQISAGVSGALGRAPGQGVAPGESAAMLFGLKTGLGDSFRLAWRAARSGESAMASQLGKVDLPRHFNRGATRAISSTAFNLDEAGLIGRTVDFLGAATEAPGRLLLTEDEFFKSVGYRMELAAQAFRKATGEGLQGDEFWGAVAEYMADPPEGLRIASADAALYNTFTNQTGEFGQALSRLRQAGGSANPVTFIMPFMRTPLNIARYAFERSPVAPLVRQWRDEVRAGGARADLALARMGTGTTIMLLASDLAMSGTVSGRGPKDPGEREAMIRQGWQPYSILVGDRWYSYNRADPFGMTMGFAADFTEALNRGDIDPEDVDEWQEVMAGMIASVGQVSVSKTYLSGMSEFFEMMSDPTRFAPSFVNRFLGSFVPSGVAAVERLVDPVTREASTPYERIVSRLPGLSERLTPRRDLWGEEMKPDSGLGNVYDTFSPVYARKVKDSPVDREIVRLGADVRRITKKTSFQGVDVNFKNWPEVYDAYTRLAGNELKHPAWGMGAKELLDAVVSGKHDLSEVYRLRSDGKDGGKAAYIRETVRQFRDLAQRAIMDDPKFESFHRYIEGKKVTKRQKAMPAGESVVLQ